MYIFIFMYRRPKQDEDVYKRQDNTQDIFLVTKKGMCIRFKETDVRVTGRVSMGVIGMRFDEDDEVIGMQMESQGEHLLVVSENGMGKRTLSLIHILPSKADLRRVRSRAFLAAALARCARMDFSHMTLATAGFCSRK